MIRRTDMYGSDEREENKRVMEYPARPKTKLTLERRVRYVRRWWYGVNDDYKAVVWVISVFVFGVVFWTVWMVFPR